MSLYALQPSYLEDIPAMRHHLRTERRVNASAARAFDILATGEGQREWAHGYRSTTWYGTMPYGSATVRDIHLRWITVRERFLAWEPGRRFSFSADAMSIPLARRMIEDIIFVPLDENRCVLRWQVHLDTAAMLRPVQERIVSKTFAPMFDRFAAGLASYAESAVAQRKS
ncbi:SRPBCC family protein [Nocardia alba]|uniref:Polyketide cyclase/dehydrase/lipid transport protein n=1 Tax=Nocardia alba TaxID=225051 RepID=A0A4R1FQH2_9NOCA|nr:SRPBCC family protein [Nocardia alba]TCJ97137.1 polyketide cyclase/dehydrase/lipid transport protein [Nocardia alba]